MTKKELRDKLHNLYLKQATTKSKEELELIKKEILQIRNELKNVIAEEVKQENQGGRRK